jgi:hypothetical protein
MPILSFVNILASSFGANEPRLGWNATGDFTTIIKRFCRGFQIV